MKKWLIERKEDWSEFTLRYKIILIMTFLVSFFLAEEIFPFKRQPDIDRNTSNFLSSRYSGMNKIVSGAYNINEAWVKYYASNIVPSEDNVADIAIDNSGNVYVTGNSNKSQTGRDFLTVKYNSSGVQLWTVRYDGNNGDDEPSAICVDSSGNVYVTGKSKGIGTGDDYATVKYDASGVEQWSVHYDGPGNSFDLSNALTIDDSGNVYVTGGSYNSDMEYDYLTIKYNASGVEKWIIRYNGPGNDTDIAKSIDVDGVGNVYVTGKSKGIGTGNDYATIKYDASGIEQWTARYNGPGNSSDWANSLSVDDSGNVYVAGQSSSSWSSWDYATIKYNTSGVEQWVARYNGQGNGVDRILALTIDGAGNVYVTGHSVTSGSAFDCVTIKYNSSGVIKWLARYSGPSNDFYEFNGAVDIAVDGAGNVYVTGESWGGFRTESGTLNDYMTIKYNASGVEQWVARYNGTENSEKAVALAVDDAGNVYVTGLSYYSLYSCACSGGSHYDYNYTTIKYDVSGTEQWVEHYDGPGNSFDLSKALAVDDAGNVYVTGWSYSSDTDYDYLTIKYDASGGEQWIVRYDGSGNFNDEVNALSVDGAGNVYVTGKSWGSSGSYDYTTVKYDASGVEKWVVRYNGLGNAYDKAIDLTVDDEGNVYVTGSSIGSSSLEFATIKYNTFGVEQWTAHYNGPNNSSDWAKSISVDDAGNVYVTGQIAGYGFTDYVTIKYNASGVEQWITNFDPEGIYDYASALTVDGNGNVYVTGSSWISGTKDDYATIKYNTLGIEQWVARYNGPGNLDDNVNALTVDDAGNVYVTGWSYGSETDRDYATIKYDALGIEQWVARYNGPGNATDVAVDLAVDAVGNVYVTGGINWGSGTDYDYVTIKYDTSGVWQWGALFEGPGYSNDIVLDLSIDGTDNLYVTGYSEYNSGLSYHWRNYTTIKYSEIATQVVIDDPKLLPKDFNLGQNYPNPFNPTTAIQYSLPKTEYVTISVYNSLGQLVRTLLNEQKSAGEYNLIWDGTNQSGMKVSSGLYLYSLKAGEFRSVKKMLLIK
jgi:uncharacterized delta-60 repeat protein